MEQHSTIQEHAVEALNEARDHLLQLVHEKSNAAETAGGKQLKTTQDMLFGACKEHELAVEAAVQSARGKESECARAKIDDDVKSIQRLLTTVSHTLETIPKSINPHKIP